MLTTGICSTEVSNAEAVHNAGHGLRRSSMTTVKTDTRVTRPRESRLVNSVVYG